MPNEIKTALLKQVEKWKSSSPVRGVVRFYSERSMARLSVINLEKIDGGEYFFVCNERVFRLTDLEGQEFYLDNGQLKSQSVALVFYDGKAVFSVATGSFISNSTNYSEAIEYAQKYFKKQDEKNEERVVFQEEIYNDEAIATVDYYQFERQGECVDAKAVNSQGFDDGKDEQGEEEKEGNVSQDEVDWTCEGECRQEESPFTYFSKIKTEIEALFKEYPKEENLCKVVTNSKWVKIGDEGKHYVVGVLFKDKEPRFVCYGLPGMFGERPQGAENFAFFIPISLFDLKGEGYWVSCQNANDGKCVY